MDESMIDSSEAILILRKWTDEKALLLCRWGTSFASTALTTTISEISEIYCALSSRKGEATLCLRLDERITTYRAPENICPR
jgi:hypothetical protein